MRLRCTILYLFLSAGLMARSAPNSSIKDSATIIIKLDNYLNNNETIDSVYLVLDRYDLTGAGVIRQVLHPVNNSLELRVPKGKYFINLRCLGSYKDKRFDLVYNLKSRKINMLYLRVEPTSFYRPGFVYIPAEKVDFSRLSICSNDLRHK